MTLRNFALKKIQIPKRKLDKCLKSLVSEDPSTSNMGDTPKHCWNVHHSIFIWFIDTLEVHWVRKSLSYCIAKFFGLLVNTLATNEKYPVLNRDNLTIRIQMQLSQKHETFSQFFAKFLKYIKPFKYFEKKDDPHRFCISEITDSESVVR